MIVSSASESAEYTSTYLFMSIRSSIMAVSTSSYSGSSSRPLFFLLVISFLLIARLEDVFVLRLSSNLIFLFVGYKSGLMRHLRFVPTRFLDRSEFLVLFVEFICAYFFS